MPTDTTTPPADRDTPPAGRAATASEGRAAGQTATTVERSADVLLLFAEPGAATLGVTEIAGHLGLSKPAVHRILAALRVRGLIELDEDTRRYSLGLSTMRLGLAYLDRLDIRTLAAPELPRLSRLTSETATLSIRTPRGRVYIDQITPDREVIMAVTLGIPYPLHAGASSKAFLAFLTDEEIDDELSAAPLDPLTDATLTDPGALRAEIAEIRRTGFARSTAERQPGSASVAAPVLDHHGRPVGVISVCGPHDRFRAEAGGHTAALLDTTRRLSHRLGHQPG
ncbi:IclR family transcriptional regulator [Streptomyces uncialis]|uniref:IclR family transcriptional regulator n=1 Tax=Streptomyces uncialis TaxID=1048205 RepID=UPI003815ED5E